MIERFAAVLRRLQRNLQLLLCLGLPDELGQTIRTQLQLKGVIIIDVRGRDQPFGICAGDYLFVGCVHTGDVRPSSVPVQIACC